MASVTLTTNGPALGVERRLAQSTGQLMESFERLSSGLRINRASDDAAGLAIADTLRTNSRLYSAAIRNVNDGISMLNIMSGSVSEQSGVLIRLLELAEQSANGTLSSEQRNSLNAEYQALLSEFGRLGDTTEFNGQSLLLAGRSGEAEEIILQAGIDGSTSSELSVETADSGSLSGVIDREGAAFGGGLSAVISFSNHASEEPFAFDDLSELYSNQLLRATVIDDQGVSRDLLVGHASATSSSFSDAAFAVYEESESGSGSYNFVGNTGGVAIDLDTGVLENGDSIAVSLDDGTNIELDFSGLRLLATSSSDRKMNAIDFTGVETVDRAYHALDTVEVRLAELGESQGKIGAAQSRLDTSLSLLGTSLEDTKAAESRIRDVDIADESARLAREQIRQQAGAAVLGLANQQPQLLLSLLDI